MNMNYMVVIPTLGFCVYGEKEDAVPQTNQLFWPFLFWWWQCGTFCFRFLWVKRSTIVRLLCMLTWEQSTRPWVNDATLCDVGMVQYTKKTYHFNDWWSNISYNIGRFAFELQNWRRVRSSTMFTVCWELFENSILLKWICWSAMHWLVVILFRLWYISFWVLVKFCKVVWTSKGGCHQYKQEPHPFHWRSFFYFVPSRLFFLIPGIRKLGRLAHLLSRSDSLHNSQAGIWAMYVPMIRKVYIYIYIKTAAFTTISTHCLSNEMKDPRSATNSWVLESRNVRIRVSIIVQNTWRPSSFCLCQFVSVRFNGWLTKLANVKKKCFVFFRPFVAAWLQLKLHRSMFSYGVPPGPATPRQCLERKTGHLPTLWALRAWIRYFIPSWYANVFGCGYSNRFSFDQVFMTQAFVPKRSWIGPLTFWESGSSCLSWHFLNLTALTRNNSCIH